MVFWLQPLILFDVRPKLENGAHAKEQTHCSGHFFFPFIFALPPLPAAQLSVTTRSSHPVTQTDCLCRCYLLLREGTANMTYARSSAVPKNCNLGRIAAQAWRCSARYAVPRTHARTHTVGSVPRVAVGLLSQKCPGPVSLCVAAPPVVTACQSD